MDHDQVREEPARGADHDDRGVEGTCVAAPAGLKRIRRTMSFLVLSYMRIRCTVFLTKRHPLKDDPT